MKLTNKHITALKRARELIAREDEDYICEALSLSDEAYELEERIAELLFPNSSLAVWLSDIEPAIPDEHFHGANLRAYRLRWIDHMIATRRL